ncbi:MAG: outer membrane protein assembly factor BamA [Rhodobacteraceae bacterium]|nr:outer membrane protein assembly factor BamA [Paracoccaceae bacterium]
MGPGNIAVPLRVHATAKFIHVFRACALNITFALITVSCLVFPTDGAAQDFRFNLIQVEGNQRIETATIIAYTGIEPGQSLTAGELNDAFQRVEEIGVFETVDFDVRGGILIIRVQEYPTINVISFEGNLRIRDEVLERVIEAAPRRVFNPAVAERDANVIAEAYAQEGRIASRVTPRIIRRSDNRVDLVYEISEGDTIEVERISFVGNRMYSDRRLRGILETKQAGILRAFIRSDTLIEDRIELDKQVLNDFYQSRGYINFRVLSTNVELTQERDGFFVTFNIEEGQQFRFGEITVTSELPEADADEYRATIRSKPEDIYSPLAIENAIIRQERLGIRQGIDFLRVEPRITRNDRNLTLDVEYVLTRGPRIFVERIDIEGNTTTLDRVIRQQFRIVEGDPFNPGEIRQSAERIRALGYFADTNVDIREGSAPDQVIVDVDVEEQLTGSLNIGGSFSTSDGFGIAIGLREDNFLGRGQRLAFNWSTAEESEAFTFDFTEPYLLGRELSFNIGLGYQETDSSFTAYDTGGIFFRPSLTFPISGNGRLTLSYSYDDTEMLQRSSLENGAVIGKEIALGSVITSALGLAYTYDSRRTGLNPNAGVQLRFGADFAGLGGDNQFVKTTARALAQTRVLGEEVVLRAAIEGGAIAWANNSNARAVDRFVLNPRIMRGFEPGGIGPRDQSLREDGSGGAADDALGGNLFTVVQLEAQFPLGLPEEIGMRGALFYDIGNLWDLNGADLSEGAIVGEGGSFRHVIGASILWDTVIGPLRFNFSRALIKEEFDAEQSFDLTLSAQF